MEGTSSAENDKPDPLKPERITIGELPEVFMRDVLMHAFSDFSVSVSRLREGSPRIFTPLGTGVLVQKEKRFGILTAHHCLHACNPSVQIGVADGDDLLLILRGQKGARVKSHEIAEYVLATPKTPEFGPDLTFIEFLAPNLLAAIQAIGSFWSLDKDVDQILADFGTVGTPLGHIGFPEFDYETVLGTNSLHHKVRHMIYSNAIGKGDVFDKDGWDYLESTIGYPGDDIPLSFAGVSGGPVWGMEIIHKAKADTWSIGKSALVGITFYQTALENNKRRLRAHFIKSIYDLAWRNVD